MINTIFYFVDDETFDYNAALLQETISPYTIVFNKSDKTIKMGGVSYGQMDRADIASSLSNISDILPVASSSTLGAIKIGYTSTTGQQNRSYAVQLDENNRAFVAVPWTDTITPAYDDTNLQDAIATERNRVTGIINGLEEDIQDKIEYLFGDTAWITNNIGEIQHKISDDTKKFLRDYGVYGIDGNGDEVLYIADLRSAVEGLTANVGTTTGNTAAISSLDLKVNGEYVATALAAGTSTSDAIDVNTILKQAKQRDTVIIGDKFRTDEFNTLPADPTVIYKRNSVYFTLVKTPGVTDSIAELSASISSLDQSDDTNNLLKMAASVLDLKASQNGSNITTTSQLSSAINNGEWTGYSGLQTLVNQTATGMTANSSLLSTLTKSTDPNNANYGKLSDSLMAGIKSEVSTDTDTKISTARTQLISDINDNTAGITVLVTKDTNGVIDSGITLKADQVTIDADQTTFKTAIGNLVETDVLKSGTGIFKGHILGGDITLTGDTPQDSDVDGVGRNTSVIKLDSNGIRLTLNGDSPWGDHLNPTSSFDLDADGSGHLANRNISWDTSGNVTINGSGTFAGSLSGAMGDFTGVVNASQFKAGNDNGFSITTSANALTFNWKGTPRAWFSLCGWDSVNNTFADPVENPQGFYLYLTNPADGHIITIDFDNITTAPFKDLNATYAQVHRFTGAYYLTKDNSTNNAVETELSDLYYTVVAGANSGEYVSKYWTNSEATTAQTSPVYVRITPELNAEAYTYVIKRDIVNSNDQYTLCPLTLYRKMTFTNGEMSSTNEFVGVMEVGSGNNKTRRFFVVDGTRSISSPNTTIINTQTGMTLNNGAPGFTFSLNLTITPYVVQDSSTMTALSLNNVFSAFGPYLYDNHSKMGRIDVTIDNTQSSGISVAQPS